MRRGPLARTNGSASPHGVALTTDGSKLYVDLENADIPGIVVYDARANRESVGARG